MLIRDHDGVRSGSLKTGSRMNTQHVVLVDDDGYSIGAADRKHVHNQATPLHLAHSCYIFDQTGRLYVTRSLPAGSTWPSSWTVSCCGHPAPGEALTHAVKRRAFEKLGVEITEIRLILPRFRYRTAMTNGIVENELCPVFSAMTSQLPQPDRAEMDAIRLFEWPDLVQAVIEGDFKVSPRCREQVRALAGLNAAPQDWEPACPDLLPPAAIWCESC